MTVGEPSDYHVGHVGGRCTTVHPENEFTKDDGPRKGPQAIGGVRVDEWIWRSRCIESGFCGKVSGETRERAGCIELEFEYILEY